MGGQVDPLGIVQEISVWPYEQIVYAQLNISPGEWHTYAPLEFWHTNGTCKIESFAVQESKSKIERKWKEGKIPWPCKGIEETVENDSDDYTNRNSYSHQRIKKGTEGLGNTRTNRDQSKLLHYWDRPEYWE